MVELILWMEGITSFKLQVSGRKIKDSQLIKRIKRMGEVILWMEGLQEKER